MTDQHLAPVCPHCGRQDCPNTRWMRSNVVFEGGCRPMGSHACDREDYLTDECAAAEERAEIEAGRAKDLDALNAAWHRKKLRANERAEKWRKRARKWKRRAARAEGFSSYWEDAFIKCDAERRDEVKSIKRERDEARAGRDAAELVVARMNDARMAADDSSAARYIVDNQNLRAELDALRVRARGMREALMDGARVDMGLPPGACRDAAGEPIP